MSKARVIRLEVDAVRVDPEKRIEATRNEVELVVPARRAGVDIPQPWADAEERWATDVAAYQAGELGVHFTLFAVLEEEGTTDRFEFGGVGSAWVRTEDRVQAEAARAADAYRPMLWDDILEDDTVEDISEGDFDALPTVVRLDDTLRGELASELSPREPPAPPNV